MGAHGAGARLMLGEGRSRQAPPLPDNPREAKVTGPSQSPRRAAHGEAPGPGEDPAVGPPPGGSLQQPLPRNHAAFFFVRAETR